MGTAILTRGFTAVDLGETEIEECLISGLAIRKAVRAEGDSVSLNPEYMEVGRFYLVELKGEPYLYRKVSDHEVEVYGLAGQD